MKKASAAMTMASVAAVAIASTAILRSGKLPSTDTIPVETPFVIKADKAVKETPPMRIAPRGPMRAKAMDVPFIEDFSSASTLGDWGIQDVNNDNNSWEYKESFGLVRCMFPSGSPANDDWLVTPAINLGKDDIYTLTFSFGSQGSRYAPEALTVTMGTSEYATRHTTVLFSRDDILNFWNGSMETVTITLPVEEDGAYYFGFHCTSPSGGYSLYLDDVKVEQNGSYTAPGPVTGFSVIPAAKGALKADISLIAPDQTADGEPLSSLDNVKLYRDEEPIHTFDNPSPGATLNVTDDNPSNGFHTYKAIATADGLEGAKAEVKVFVGVDTPMAVTQVTAVENTSDVTLSWAAPLGVNGGYVGPEVVRYAITRIDSDGENIVDDAWDELTFTDPDVDFSTQNHVYYTVKAYTHAGEADAVSSNSLFVGPAIQIPFTESFAYGNLATSPWVMEYIDPGYFPTQWRTTPMGSLPTCPPVDGDDGMLEFVSKISGFNLYEGNVVRLATPAINLQDAENPFVSFYLFHYDTTTISQEYDAENDEYLTVTTTYDDKLHLQVAIDNGEYADIPDSEILLAKDNSGWNLYTIPLDAYKGHAKVSVGLVGTAGGGGNICVDRLTVTDSYTADLAFTGLLGPAQVKVGERAEYTANIVNNGVSSTKNYTVDLYVDDVKVDSQKGPGAAIFANGGQKTVKVGFTPDASLAGAEHRLHAVISFPDDQCQANNRSETITLSVPGNSFPKVDNLSGNVTDGKVTLTWDEPEFEAFRAAVNDDMEAHAAFAISGIGDYTLIDNDQAAKTYVVSGIDSYPNAGAKMAWQVFDPATAGIDTDLDFNRRWICHSGKQCLISWGADVSTGVTANDDWLISPELSGEKQTITFFIKSVTLAYPERFRVLYSCDGKSMSDFVKIAEANYYTPTSYWRKFSVTLPEGARYFAIHCISADGFGLMVDDISLIPASSSETEVDFHGYNVYRDGAKINGAPLGEPSYTDESASAGAHRYYVTALYAEGESDPSPMYDISTSGIDQAVAATSESFHVTGHIGCMEVDGCHGRVEVFSLDGRHVASERVTGNLTFSIPAGTYLVSCGKRSVKVIVK